MNEASQISWIRLLKLGAKWKDPYEDLSIRWFNSLDVWSQQSLSQNLLQLSVPVQSNKRDQLIPYIEMWNSSSIASVLQLLQARASFFPLLQTLCTDIVALNPVDAKLKEWCNNCLANALPSIESVPIESVPKKQKVLEDEMSSSLSDIDDDKVTGYRGSLSSSLSVSFENEKGNGSESVSLSLEEVEFDDDKEKHVVMLASQYQPSSFNVAQALEELCDKLTRCLASKNNNMLSQQSAVILSPIELELLNGGDAVLIKVGECFREFPDEGFFFLCFFCFFFLYIYIIFIVRYFSTFWCLWIWD